MNVSMIGYLNHTKIPVSIDIGFGDFLVRQRRWQAFIKKKKVILNVEQLP